MGMAKSDHPRSLVLLGSRLIPTNSSPSEIITVPPFHHP
jgi:hypothetical protein